MLFQFELLVDCTTSWFW